MSPRALLPSQSAGVFPECETRPAGSSRSRREFLLGNASGKPAASRPHPRAHTPCRHGSCRANGNPPIASSFFPPLPQAPPGKGGKMPPAPDFHPFGRIGSEPVPNLSEKPPSRPDGLPAAPRASSPRAPPAGPCFSPPCRPARVLFRPPGALQHPVASFRRRMQTEKAIPPPTASAIISSARKSGSAHFSAPFRSFTLRWREEPHRPMPESGRRKSRSRSGSHVP